MKLTQNYITSNLLPEEKVIYRGHRHWIVFALPAVWLIVTLVLLMNYGYDSVIVMFSALMTLMIATNSTIDYLMSEIGVTDMRVLIKIGFIARNSLETNLKNIASIQVEQSVLGRILNYGTIIICDTGYLRTPFARIQNPFAFRRAVLKQINKK